MPDAPDDYGLNPNSTLDSMIDSGELAVRLLSPINMYRTGSYIFVDDCNHGTAPYLVLKTGTGANVLTSSELSYIRGHSLKCTCGNAATNFAELNRITYISNPGTIGLYTAFTVNADHSYLSFTISYAIGGIQYIGSLRYNVFTGLFQLKTGAITYVDLITINPANVSFPIFMPIKLVIDIDNKTYKYLFIGGVRYEINDVALVQSIASTDSLLQSSITLLNTGIGTNDVYVGAYGISIGEP